MNDVTRTHPARSTRLASSLIGAGVALWLSGCNALFNPFSQEDFVTLRAEPETLRRIEPMSIARHSQREPITIEQAVEERTTGWMIELPSSPEAPVELTLADVRAAALANNLDLRVALYEPGIAEETISEEEAQFEAVFTAALRRSRVDSPSATTLSGTQVTTDDFDFGVRLPMRTGGTVNVNLPMNRTETNNIFATLNPAFTTDLQFSISQPLLRNAGLKANTHGIRVAKYQKQIADAQTKLEAIRILANADRAYWRLYAARRELEVRQQQYELAMAQLERARRRVEAGEDAEIEILRAESGLAERMEAIIIADNNVRNRERELKRIINIDELSVTSLRSVITATGPNPVRLDLDPTALAAMALDQRMEMLELEVQLAIDMSTIDLERNRALPLFTLDYVYNINGLGDSYTNAFRQTRDKSFEDWTVALNAEIPLGNEAARSRVNRAMLQRFQRLATREQRALAIRQEVADAVDQLTATWQRILAARQAAILAGRRLEGEQRQFEVGLRTSTDVLDAATALADAQSAEIRALSDHQIALVDIAFATGTLLGQGRIDWQPIDLSEQTVQRSE